jgi:hypothetical protein
MRQLLYRASIAITVFWALAILPSPTESVPLCLKNGLVGIAGVLYIGKLLYDTLFFDRYRQ